MSNHHHLVCLPNLLLKRTSKKTSKHRVPEGNPPVTRFRSQRASDAEMFPFDDVIMCLFHGTYSWDMYMLLSDYWNGKVVTLTNIYSLGAHEVVTMTTSGAASGHKVVNMTTFLVQWAHKTCYFVISPVIVAWITVVSPKTKTSVDMMPTFSSLHRGTTVCHYETSCGATDDLSPVSISD